MSQAQDAADNIRLKMTKGTTRDEHICPRCTHYFHRRGASAGDDLQLCEHLSYMAKTPILIRGNVAECSSFYDDSLPSLRSMSEIAWELKTGKGGRAMGFTPPTKKKEREDD